MLSDVPAADFETPAVPDLPRTSCVPHHASSFFQSIRSSAPFTLKDVPAATLETQSREALSTWRLPKEDRKAEAEHEQVQVQPTRSDCESLHERTSRHRRFLISRSRSSAPFTLKDVPAATLETQSREALSTWRLPKEDRKAEAEHEQVQVQPTRSDCESLHERTAQIHEQEELLLDSLSEVLRVQDEPRESRGSQALVDPTEWRGQTDESLQRTDHTPVAQSRHSYYDMSGASELSRRSWTLSRRS